VLDRQEYPGAREKLMVPRSNGYSALLTRAAVFLETLPAIKSAFIERGMPADFDLRLQGLIQEFKAATDRRTNGLYTQVGSTAGMKARLREAVRAVRELDVILSLLLQHAPRPLRRVEKRIAHRARSAAERQVCFGHRRKRCRRGWKLGWPRN
jgi:hypothetical protein